MSKMTRCPDEFSGGKRCGLPEGHSGLHSALSPSGVPWNVAPDSRPEAAPPGALKNNVKGAGEILSSGVGTEAAPPTSEDGREPCAVCGAMNWYARSLASCTVCGGKCPTCKRDIGKGRQHDLYCVRGLASTRAREEPEEPTQALIDVGAEALMLVDYTNWTEYEIARAVLRATRAAPTEEGESG